MSWYNRYYEKIGKEVKDITEELPFEIPDTWEWCRFQNIIKINGGFAFKSENYTTKGKGVRVLRISDFNEDGFNNKRPVYHPYSETLKSFELELNDIIMCMTGGTVGKSFYIETLPEPMVVNQRVADIKISNSVDKKYFYLFILSPYIQKIIDENKNSTNDNISVVLINSFLVPLPPFYEQERIVAEIEKYEPLLVEYDRLEQQATKLDDEIYDKLKKSILQYAIQGKLVEQDENDEPASVLLERIRDEKKAKLGKKYVESYIYKGDDNCYYEKVGGNTTKIDDLPFDIPNSWCWVRLGDIGDWGAGATPQRGNPNYYNNGTIPWLKTGELNNSYIYDSEERITEFALEKCSLRYNQIGDVLIAMYGATIGKLGIVGKPLTTNQACCACTPCQGIYNEYLFYLLMANKDNFIKMGFGGAQPNISREKITIFFAPIPPIAEQHRIVEKLKEII